MSNQNQNDRSKKFLSYLVLGYFEEGARGTNFYKSPIFAGFGKIEIRETLRALVQIDYIYRIDTKTTNGSAYEITATGRGYMAQLEKEEGFSQDEIIEAV